jgi:DNA-sulfur modification-associated
MNAIQLRRIPALKVNQWLTGWNKIGFDPAQHRGKPPPHFYLFTLPARELRSLSGIMRRQAQNAQPRTQDLGIQRQHDPERSEEISRFVEYGYPWSTLSESKRISKEFNDLRKPGWLPTAVVINILTHQDEREGTTVADEDIATIIENDGCYLQLPYAKWAEDWSPSKVPPFEVIDGQHRLWAFDATSHFANYELPVVAFVGLDISWQAYLFWTINIKPKRINASLAFDLYPLLRSEDWLDRAEGHAIYRETRAQELTEILWSHPASPWYDKINMLGERNIPWVSQSAWIRSLIATMVRSWDGRSGNPGGLFGGRSKQPDEVLGWNRAQQSAFLIYMWDSLKIAVSESQSDWAIAAPGLDDEMRRAKRVFRGSGGYKELRIQLLDHLAKGEGEIAAAAARLRGTI